jgi:hypothetical protein
MTTTAKILVVLNLLLAVLFLGFSASSMTARLGMQDSIKKLDKEKKVAADNVAVEKQNADKVEKENKALATDLNLAKKSYEQLKTQTDNQLDNMTADMVQYRKQLDATSERIKQVTAEAVQRKEEIDQARKQNQDLVAKNVTAMNDLSAARDQIQDLRSQNERVNDKLRVSEEKYKLLVNYLVANKITIPSPDELVGIPEATAPPAVEGVVREVRDGGKLMEISLGENDGLRSKHRLMIYRTDPAKYVGDVEVIRTWPDRAVVRPIETLLAPPQKGDRVGISSNINRG